MLEPNLNGSDEPIDPPPKRVPLAGDHAEAFLAELQTLALQLKKVTGAMDAGALAPAARAVLDSLQNGGPGTVPELGRMRGTSRQNIQVIVNRLAAEGCVEFSSNPAHKRSDLASITEKGRSVLRSSPDPQRQLAAQVAQDIPGADLARGKELFERLKAILNQVDRPGVTHAPQVVRSKTAHSQPAPAEESNEFPVNLL